MEHPYSSIDLQQLTLRLKELFASSPPEGPIVGRTQIRDAVLNELKCSELEAEQLVDTLAVQHRIVFRRPPEGPGLWLFEPAGRDGAESV